MEIALDLRKSFEENAAMHFEKAKKLKRKAEGAEAAVLRLRKQIAQLEQEDEKIASKQILKPRATRPRDWFEKFRWFYSSEGFLCIGGRDSSTNEEIVKKHMSPDDIVFHTEAPGSPFFIIKSEGRTPGEETIQEAAIATASYSKAWKLGLFASEVYWVKPEQVSKFAEAGTSLPKGAFMIYGKRHVMQPKIELTIGLRGDGRGIGGPLSAIASQTKNYIVIMPGSEKASDVAKMLVKRFGGIVEEYQPFIPGTCKIL